MRHAWQNGWGLIVFLKESCKTNAEKKRATRRGKQVAVRRAKTGIVAGYRCAVVADHNRVVDSSPVLMQLACHRNCRTWRPLHKRKPRNELGRSAPLLRPDSEPADCKNHLDAV